MDDAGGAGTSDGVNGTAGHAGPPSAAGGSGGLANPGPGCPELPPVDGGQCTPPTPRGCFYDDGVTSAACDCTKSTSKWSCI